MCWIWECLHLVWNRFTLISVDIDKIYQRKSCLGCSERKIIRRTNVERRTWKMRRVFLNGLAFRKSNDLCRRSQHRKRDSLMNLLPKCYTAKKIKATNASEEDTWSSQKEKNSPHIQNRSEFMVLFFRKSKTLELLGKEMNLSNWIQFLCAKRQFLCYSNEFLFKKNKNSDFFLCIYWVRSLWSSVY